MPPKKALPQQASLARFFKTAPKPGAPAAAPATQASTASPSRRGPRPLPTTPAAAAPRSPARAPSKSPRAKGPAPAPESPAKSPTKGSAAAAAAVTPPRKRAARSEEDPAPPAPAPAAKAAPSQSPAGKRKRGAGASPAPAPAAAAESPAAKRGRAAPAAPAAATPKAAGAAASPPSAGSAGGGSAPQRQRSGWWAGRDGYSNAATNKGCKPKPQGFASALDTLSFLVTGSLESLDREEAQELIKHHGGSIKSGVSKKLSYLVVGENPGESKVAKARELGTPSVSEDGLLALIAAKSKAKGVDAWQAVGGADKVPRKWGGTAEGDTVAAAGGAEVAAAAAQRQQRAAAAAAAPLSPGQMRKEQEARRKRREELSAAVPLTAPAEAAAAAAAPMQLWADKYAPRSMGDMVGVSSKVNELKEWLLHWEHNRSRESARRREEEQRKKEKGRKDSQDQSARGSAGSARGGGGGAATGEWKAAVLISGPPGIGKTTAAHLVCKACGYDCMEFNASDHRSAGSLQANVTSALGTCGVANLFNGGGNRKRVAVIMDEVDGCDRGGTGELIKIIKSIRAPLICLCNDRHAQKLRSLAGYCLDLPFSRPPKNVISGYLRKLLREHEGVELNEVALQEVYESENNDLRSTLNNLQLWTRTQSDFSKFSDLKAASATSLKNIDMSPFQAAGRVFSDGGRMRWEEAQRLFFDNELLGLFVQENYIHSGGRAGAARIDAMAAASRSIAYADRLERSIRSEQKWQLGPANAFFALFRPMRILGNARLDSYLPPAARQYLPVFPSYLGKNSTIGKQMRLLLCLARQACEGTDPMQSGLRGIVMDYLPAVRAVALAELAKPQQQGVETAFNLLSSYGFLKDDWDFTQDVTNFKKLRHKEQLPVADAKTKSALTRLLNKAADQFAAKAFRSKMGAPVTAEPDEAEGDGEDRGDDSGEEKEEDKTQQQTLPAVVKGKAGGAGAAQGGKRKRAG
eukprot:TRINITY_DN2100_c0_g2_i1.p1 TRINITY_DN2100_c0_g2~~TRINITY_DN2100_c0_g2_i1.p1  ORF type:complete len:1004 (+),score=367.09 TRINITY_DN2100_c0_g2_i1:88-3012(+)